MVTETNSLCSVDEIRQITGKKRVSAQVRWLQRHGWIFVVNGSGKVVVARSQAEAKLNPPITHQITHNTGQDAPDWSGWNAK